MAVFFVFLAALLWQTPVEAAQAVAQFRVGIRIVALKQDGASERIRRGSASTALSRTARLYPPPLPRKRPAMLVPASLVLPSVPEGSDKD